MMPGPNIILQPPGCQKPVKIESALSGNTFGAVWWSDGKCNAPMLEVTPRLMKSPTEGVFFWIDDCKEIGEEEFFLEGEHSPWPGVEFAEEPTEEDLFALVESEHASDIEKRCYLRTQLWWTGNDHIRWEKAKELPENHLQNLQMLLHLMGQMENPEGLVRAEILRELSLFQESLDLLKVLEDDEETDWGSLIREMAEKQDPLVAVLHSDSLRFERGAHGPKEEKKRKRRRNRQRSL